MLSDIHQNVNPFLHDCRATPQQHLTLLRRAVDCPPGFRTCTGKEGTHEGHTRRSKTAGRRRASLAARAGGSEGMRRDAAGCRCWVQAGPSTAYEEVYPGFTVILRLPLHHRAYCWSLSGGPTDGAPALRACPPSRRPRPRKRFIIARKFGLLPKDRASTSASSTPGCMPHPRPQPPRGTRPGGPRPDRGPWPVRAGGMPSAGPPDGWPADRPHARQP
jgi:hypothetical protein